MELRGLLAILERRRYGRAFRRLASHPRQDANDITDVRISLEERGDFWAHAAAPRAVIVGELDQEHFAVFGARGCFKRAF